ncbi:MAG: PQQ-binding-like beta-propeller repeat protein [Actinomycetota bacterium]
MRPRLLLPVAAVLLVIGVTVFVVAGRWSCDEAFGTTDSRFRPIGAESGDSESTEASAEGADGRLPRPSDDAIGPVRWVLGTDEVERGSGLVDLDSWVAHVTRSEISRIDGDGTIRWTRATPRNRVTDLGDGRLGVLAFVGSTMRLAVIDGDGELLRCDRHGPINGGFAGDDAGGYAVVAAPVDGGADDTIDQVRRIEPDGAERWTVDLDTDPGQLVDEIDVGGGLTIVGRTDPLDGTVLTAIDDVTGELRWTIDDTEPGMRPVDGIHGVVDGRLYVSVEHDPDDAPEDQQRSLLAIDPATGEVQWNTPIGFDTFAARAIGVDGLVVLVTSANATAIDPRSGTRRWSGPFGAVAIDAGDHGAAITERDGRLLYPAGSGRLLDLRTGASTLLFDPGTSSSVASLAIDRGVLLAELVVVDGGSEVTTVLTGWTYQPGRASLDDEPIGPSPPAVDG